MRYISTRGFLWFLFGVMLVVIFSVASANEPHGDTVNIYNIYKDDRFLEGFAKGVGGVIITACGVWPVAKSFIWPATVGLFTLSKPKWRPWVNCWEDAPKDEPFPNLGPAIKVTPDNLSDGVRLSQ